MVVARIFLFCQFFLVWLMSDIVNVNAEKTLFLGTNSEAKIVEYKSICFGLKYPASLSSTNVPFHGALGRRSVFLNKSWPFPTSFYLFSSFQHSR